MKNMKWLSRVFIMALGLLAFSACSDDDDNVKLSFPEKQPIDCSVGEVKTLTFDAEYAWTLSSSRLWCKFKDGNELVSSLSGGPGQQTVTIAVTEDVWDFKDAIAEITMGMEGQTQVIAVVNRAKKLYKIEAYKQEGDSKILYNTENPAILPYGRITEIEMNVDANFDWKVKNCPEWLKVSLSTSSMNEVTMMGGANESTSWLLSVKPSFAKGKEYNVDLEIVDANSSTSFILPVRFEGIPAGEIEFNPSNWWNWVFSADGMHYWSSGGMETTKYPAPKVVNVITKDGFEFVYIDFDPQFGCAVFSAKDWHWNAWFMATVVDSQISLEVYPNNNAKEREGYLLAIPTDVYDRDFKDDLNKLLDADYFLKLEYEDKYVVTQFKQEGLKVAGFNVINNDNGESLNGQLEDVSAEWSGEYGTSNVYKLTLDPNVEYGNITVTPSGLDQWAKPGFDTYSTVIWDGVQYEADWGNFWFTVPAGHKATDMVFALTKDDVEGLFAVLIVSQKNNTKKYK